MKKERRKFSAAFKAKVALEAIKEKEARKIASELKKLLPTENKLEEITHRIIWKYVDNQSTIDEEIGIKTMTALLHILAEIS